MPNITEAVAEPGEMAAQSVEAAVLGETGDATAVPRPRQQKPGRNRKEFQARIAPSEPSDIIATDELCRRLGKSRGTVENWRRAGLIPYIQLGRSIMYSWTSLLEALKRAERRAE